MSDDQKNEDGTEWNFSVDNVKTDEENIERKARKERLAKKLNKADEKPKERNAQKDLVDGSQSKKMSLKDAPSSSRKSRARIAEEMRKADLPDFADLMASPVKRGIAFAIDAAIFGGVMYGANMFWAKIEFYALQSLIKLEVNQSLDPETFKLVVMSIFGMAFYFLFMALPVCFSKQSWGKSFTNLRIQSADEEKSIGFVGIFFREFIAKPISLATVVGSFLLFFNEDRRTLHDIVAGTVVMDDSENAKG